MSAFIWGDICALPVVVFRGTCTACMKLGSWRHEFYQAIPQPVVKTAKR